MQGQSLPAAAPGAGREVASRGAIAGRPKSVWKDVVGSFTRSPSLIYHCFLVIVCGLLTAFHWSFFFWFLERIQAKDTLLLGEW